MTYGTPHPELAGVRCDNATENHPTCTGKTDPMAFFGSYVDWANSDYVEPKVLKASSARELRERLAAVGAKTRPAVRVDDTEASGFAAGVAGSEQAAVRWTDGQIALVDAAILAVAQRHAGGREFTSDAIWEELAGKVPVTKALTSRLMRAARRRIIDNTGKTEISNRGGHHDHGQRLTVWYSLLPR